jgi:hypothetical protein
MCARTHRLLHTCAGNPGPLHNPRERHHLKPLGGSHVCHEGPCGLQTKRGLTANAPCPRIYLRGSAVHALHTCPVHHMQIIIYFLLASCYNEILLKPCTTPSQVCQSHGALSRQNLRKQCQNKHSCQTAQQLTLVQTPHAVLHHAWPCRKRLVLRQRSINSPQSTQTTCRMTVTQCPTQQANTVQTLLLLVPRRKRSHTTKHC